MAKKRKAPDWEAIEREYRAGQVSLRAIASEHGITDTAIRKRAKAEGWVRDLSGQVRERVRAELVRDEVRTPNAQASQIVEAAAATGAEVVRRHRKALGRLFDIADTLSHRLETALRLSALPPEERAELASLGMFMGEKESPADVMEKIARTLGRAIPLERQAFNLDEEAPPNPTGDANDAKARLLERLRRHVPGGDSESP